MKRILKSPLAVWTYLLIAFTAGAITGGRIAHVADTEQFASMAIKPDNEYIVFEVKRMAEERPIIEERLEQLIKVFEEHQYEVEQIRIFREGQRVNIVLEEE